MSDSALTLNGLTKRYRDVVAVDDLSVQIRRGEFVSLLGPSGCGKTTTLRMIAGFILPDAGSIAIEGEDVTLVPPFHRDIGMVFQHYALFPHMTVEDNVAFGLRRRQVAKAEIRERVREALRLVRLEGLEQRWPAAAVRACARNSHPAADPALRRAPLQSGRKAPQEHADRAAQSPGGAQDHDNPRHSRPGGGAEPVRPGRDHEPRSNRAAGFADRSLHAARERLRRELCRRIQSAAWARGAGLRRAWQDDSRARDR